MKKSIFLGCLFLAACAGNPPAWWDPSNHYAPSAQTQTAAPQQTANTVLPAQPKEEESFSFETDSEYEEMAISPEEAAERREDILLPSLLTE